MTAELRLVPTKATRKQLEDAAFNLSAEIGPDEALKLAPHIERAYELLVAAAPAVQPAAGRPVAWLLRHEDGSGPICRDHPGEWPNTTVVPLYAHPPAQGSESGGEPVEYVPSRHDGFYMHENGNRLCWMRDGVLSFWVPYEPASDAALSQPGPASEGDGE